MRIRDWYFQGWERRTDENGRKQFVYTGEVYTFPGDLKRFRSICAGLIEALIALYLLVALLPSEGGMWHYAAIPQLLEPLPLIYLLMGLVCLFRAKEPLTFRDWYASWRRLKYASIAGTVITACMALVELAYMLFEADVLSLPGEPLYLLGTFGCTALSAALWRVVLRNPFIPSASGTEQE